MKKVRLIIFLCFISNFAFGQNFPAFSKDGNRVSIVKKWIDSVINLQAKQFPDSIFYYRKRLFDSTKSNVVGCYYFTFIINKKNGNINKAEKRFEDFTTGSSSAISFYYFKEELIKTEIIKIENGDSVTSLINYYDLALTRIIEPSAKARYLFKSLDEFKALLKKD